MDAKAIRDGLGYDKPGPTGRYYSTMKRATTRKPTFGELAVLIPDGEMYYMLGASV